VPNHVFFDDVMFPCQLVCVCRYQSFLEQFAAVSYGDDLFASYLLLPLQQRFPAKLRHQLWGDHAHVLTFINISVEQVKMCGERHVRG